MKDYVHTKTQTWLPIATLFVTVKTGSNLNVHERVSRLTNYDIFIQQNSTQQTIVTQKIMDEFQNNYAEIEKPDDSSAYSTFYFYKILEIANYNDSYGWGERMREVGRRN